MLYIFKYYDSLVVWSVILLFLSFQQLGGILWIYNKWLASEYVPLNTFMPDNQINKYFENDVSF